MAGAPIEPQPLRRRGRARRRLLGLVVLAAAVAAGVLLVREVGRSTAPLRDLVGRVAGGARDVALGSPGIRATHCPAKLTGCRSARGPIVLVERVDADGDGDLHVVVAGGSVTAPGFSAIDVRKGLRPRRDPRVGDLASAAGIVQRGSYKQAQIHAREFHVVRR